MTTVLAASFPGGPIPPDPAGPSAIMLTAPRPGTLRPQERVSLTGTIAAVDRISAGLSPVYRCVLTGARGEADLLFLGHTTIAGLTVGIRCTAQGTVTVHCGRLAIWNPRYQVRP